jgi:hypothetical protein
VAKSAPHLFGRFVKKMKPQNPLNHWSECMFLHVTDAKYLTDYKVEVSFNNGRTGVADLTDALKGAMFEPLKDQSAFSCLVVDKELDTIVWSNGADLGLFPRF